MAPSNLPDLRNRKLLEVYRASSDYIRQYVGMNAMGGKQKN